MKNPKEKTFILNGETFLTITGMAEKIGCNPQTIQRKVAQRQIRHSFASNLIRAGADIKSVQLIMRHESIQITLDTYSHLLGADLEAAVDKIG